MNFDWYELTDFVDFVASGLVSRSVTVILGDVGEKTILFTKGNMYGVTIDGVFLAIGLNDRNPFSFDGYSVFYDADGVLWIGIENEN